MLLRAVAQIVRVRVCGGVCVTSSDGEVCTSDLFSFVWLGPKEEKLA